VLIPLQPSKKGIVQEEWGESLQERIEKGESSRAIKGSCGWKSGEQNGFFCSLIGSKEEDLSHQKKKIWGIGIH